MPYDEFRLLHGNAEENSLVVVDAPCDVRCERHAPACHRLDCRSARCPSGMSVVCFGQAGDVEAEEEESFGEALVASAIFRFKKFPTVPASISRCPMTWERGPGFGWGLRRQVRRVRRALESQGFVVTTCMVGRRHRLVHEGLLPHDHQDRLGMAAVLVAERPSANDGDLAGVY